MEINFFEYLINIGLINKESFSNLILDYHKKYSNNNFIENMKNLLLNFFDNLSNEEKNYMSINLVKNYLLSLEEKKIEKLKMIFMIIKEKLLYKKLKHLFKWKIISLNNEKKEEIKTNQSYEKINNAIRKINNKIKRKRYKPNELDNCISMKINTDKVRKKNIINKSLRKKIKNISSSQNDSTIKKYDSTKESINPYRKSNKNIYERFSSISVKEQEELKECTFSPQINEYSQIKRNNYTNEIKESQSNTKRLYEVFNKLHNDNLIYKNKIQFKKEKFYKKFDEENTFRPKINNNSLTKRLNKNNVTFDERQKMHLVKKEQKNKKRKKELDDNFSKLCSFVPEVNTNSNTIITLSKIKNEYNTELKNTEILMDYYTSRTGEGVLSSKRQSPFMRLYEDSKVRNLRKKSREKEYKNYLSELANISCKKEINNVNYDKLNELYLYDKKNYIIKKTKKKVENEEGTTFKPEIFINKSSKNITSSFYERNEKFIKDKENFIKSSIKERDKFFNIKENKNHDKYSKEEKNEIIKNIVKRLGYECG